MTDEQRTQFFAEIDERLQRARALNRAIRDAVAAEQSVEDAEEGACVGAAPLVLPLEPLCVDTRLST